ncbi:hypothetical protein [Kribbella sp. NPDC003557]|uniref:hypothetical protein n=1 Tax=Kribbella sp. NPDC003557 TaxID=3154449 RepID=UPI0033AB7116
MSTLADEKPEANSWFDRHQRSAWIAAGASIATALIATLVPVFANSGDDKDTAGGPAAVSTPSASTSPTASAPTTTPTPGESESPSSSGSPAGSQRWKGVLLVDAEPKDLDALPDPDGSDDKGDVFMVLNYEFGGQNSTRIAQWAGASGALPGYQECSDAVDALGSRDNVKLSKKTVLCVRTSAGNVVRLKVSKLGETSIDTHTTFDGVIWNGS